MLFFEGYQEKPKMRRWQSMLEHLEKLQQLDLFGRRALLIAYTLGGAFALVFEIAWYHAFVDQFGAGGTTFAVVLCSFIGGLGAGSLSSRRFYQWLNRKAGGIGLKNYGRTELIVSCAVLLFYFLTTLKLSPIVGYFPYHQILLQGHKLWQPTLDYQVLRIFLAVIAVGVPCFFMGLTFPYLCSLFPQDFRFPSLLYSLNTLGASASAFLTEFVGLRFLGYLGCLSFAALGLMLIGLWFLAAPPIEQPPQTEDHPSNKTNISIFPGVLSGFLCGGLQALVYVLLKFTLGPSRAAFALLAFFAIAGIWLASGAVHRFHPSRRTLRLTSWLALLWCIGIWFVEPKISEWFVVFGAHDLDSLSPYTAAFLTLTATVGIMVLVPYGLWSMLLPDLCDRLQAAGKSLSKAYGLNTFGFLAGVLLFGWILQYVHFFYAARLFACSAAAGLILLISMRSNNFLSGRLAAPVVILLAIAGFFLPRNLEMRLVGGLQTDFKVVVDYRSTPQHLFWVRKAAEGQGSILMFDRNSMSGTAPLSQTYMRLMAHFPLLLQEDPETVLLICYGVGMTADAIRMHASVRHVDVVDLNPSVFLLSSHFTLYNHNVLADPRFRLICDDGRQFLKLSKEKYDLITMEPPQPLLVGISRLYSREYYSDISRHLNPGGMVSQWLPEDQMDQRGVDLICSTFVDAFPYAFLFVGAGRQLILVGSNQPFHFGPLRNRLNSSLTVSSDLARLEIRDATQLFERILKVDGGLRSTWGRGSTSEMISDGLLKEMSRENTSPASSCAGNFLCS
jgi:predicted membrane-bound spermidine synthase